MKKIDLLRELQEVDTTLDQVRQELEEYRAKLGDDSEIVPLRQQLEEARREVKSLQAKGKDLDLDIETRNTKRRADEKKLYDGSIKNPKELGSLSQEVDMEKQQISRLEDESLLNMEALEAAVQAEASTSKELTTREQEWKAEQADLESRCGVLASREAELVARRQGIVSQVDQVTIKNYERIRRMREGVAVVAIQRGACQGCRVSLSSIIAQRARSSEELVTCQSCGRILYLP